MILFLSLVTFGVLGTNECPSLCNHEERIAIVELAVKQTEASQTCHASLNQANADKIKAESELRSARVELQMWRNAEADGLRRAHLVMILPKLHKTWSYKIEIKPVGTLPGYTNILHATTGVNCCNPGSRLPAIYFTSMSTQMHIDAVFRRCRTSA